MSRCALICMSPVHSFDMQRTPCRVLLKEHRRVPSVVDFVRRSREVTSAVTSGDVNSDVTSRDAVYLAPFRLRT